MFISPVVRRVELPHIEGAWIEVKQLTFAEKMRAFAAHPDSEAEQAVAMLSASIVAWSAVEPVTPEQVALLDDESWQALFAAINTKADTAEGTEGKGERRSGPSQTS